MMIRREKTLEKTPGLLSQTHPRSLACDNCRGDLELTRYKKNGGHYRRYTCPQCGFAAVYKRKRLDEPEKCGTSGS